MKTIVFNTLTSAVTEYAGFEFQSITPTHVGSVMGLFALGGSSDAGSPIVANISTAGTLHGETKKTSPGTIHFAIKGSGMSSACVIGENDVYCYPFPVLPGGVSRAVPGRGIRENYLAFGYSNVDGSDFELDRIIIDLPTSHSRRV